MDVRDMIMDWLEENEPAGSRTRDLAEWLDTDTLVKWLYTEVFQHDLDELQLEFGELGGAMIDQYYEDHR